jgi:hypothetical protein
MGTVVVDLLLALTVMATESTAELESIKLKSQAPAYIQPNLNDKCHILNPYCIPLPNQV